jgi:hypothetical protein
VLFLFSFSSTYPWNNTIHISIFDELLVPIVRRRINGDVVRLGPSTDAPPFGASFSALAPPPPAEASTSSSSSTSNVTDNGAVDEDSVATPPPPANATDNDTAFGASFSALSPPPIPPPAEASTSSSSSTSNVTDNGAVESEEQAIARLVAISLEVAREEALEVENEEHASARILAETGEAAVVKEREDNALYLRANYYLEDSGKEIKPIDRDGNCQFNAVVEQDDTFSTQWSLRSAVEKAYVKLIINNDTSEFTTEELAKVALLRLNFLSELKIEEVHGELLVADKEKLLGVAAEIGKEYGPYGDGNTILLLVYLLKRPIKVWSFFSPPLLYDDPIRGELLNDDPIHMFYFENIVHYDMVVDLASPRLLVKRTYQIRTQCVQPQCQVIIVEGDEGDQRTRCTKDATAAWHGIANSGNEKRVFCDDCTSRYATELGFEGLASELVAESFDMNDVEDYICYKLLPVVKRECIQSRKSNLA